jgi:glutaredoxin
MAKQYFAENNVAFVEKDVASDQVALEEMLKKSGQMGVPVIDVNGSIVIGYNREELAKLLSPNKMSAAA